MTLFITTLFHVLISSVLMIANVYHMRQLREQLAVDMHVLVVSRLHFDV